MRWTVHHLLDVALDRLIVRKEHVLCTQCGEVEPVHPGDGTPASTFIVALQAVAVRHRACSVAQRKARKE